MAGQPSQTPLHQMPAQPFGGSPRQGSHQRSPQQSVPHVPHGQPAYPAYGQGAAYPGTPYYPAYAAAPYNPYQGAPYVYYGQPGAAVPQQQAPAARATPTRKSHAIQIIDPNTGKEVNLKGQAKEDKAEHKDDAEKSKGDDAHKDEEGMKHEAEEKAKKEEEEKAKKEEEEKAKKEEEEKAKKEEEEKAKKEEEEKERARKEEEEKERVRQEEEERVRKEEEERLKKEEEERLKKEEEERLKREEEERLKKEEEERLKKEEEEKKLAEEMERLRLEDEEKKRKEEEEERLRKEEVTRKAEEERVRKEEEDKERARQEEEKRKEEETKASESAPAAEATPAEAAAAPAVEEPKPVEPPTYAPGCWSPEHTDAKRVYTIEFLMAFVDLVTKKPEGMTVFPEVDRVLAPEQAAAREATGGAGRGARRQEPMGRHMGGGPGYRQGPGEGGFRGPAGAGMRREPSLGRGRGPRGGPGMMQMPVRGPGFGMPGMMPGMHGMPMRPMYEPPVEKLKISENAWRPPVKVDPNSVDDPEQKEKIENELLFRKFKGLLNKLTVDKFDKLTEQIMALEINTSTRLKGAIYIVFDKALDEPTFSSMYAQLCLRMSKWEIPGDGEEGKPKNTFRRHLLNKCQDEFEKEREFTVSDKSVAAEDEDEAMVRAKLRMLGNIKFIGELFKLDMLTDKIMHQCVWRLLQPKQNSTVPPEESLESLCQLLSTIGKKLDVPKARDHMNAYFERLKHLGEKKEEISSRIRFMIQDAVELRESNWVPRRAEAKAKTIEEVHKEMQQEQVNKALARSTSVGRQDSRTLSRHDSRPGSYGAGRGGPQPSADGWTAVGGSGRQNKPSDLGALRSMQSRAASTGDSTNVTLGPAGRGGMGARGWGLQRTGSGKNDQQQQQQQQQPAVPQMGYRNQFDILNSTDMGDDKGPSLRPNIAQLRPQAPSPKNMRSLSPTQPPAPSAASPSGPSPAPSPKPAMSEEEFKKKAKATLEEYYSIRDLKEAITCFKELESPQLHKFIVESLFSVVDDKKKRPEAASLLVKLAEEGLLTQDDILNGVDSTFAQLDDLSMDMPKLDEYMAQYLAPLVSSGRVTLADIGKASHWEELVKDMMSIAVAKMFAAVLKQIETSSDQETAKKLWSESGLQWSTLLPENKTPEDFLASNNLAYLTA